LTCPVIELCATRGELHGAAKAVPQRKGEIHYSLHYRNGAGRRCEVFLVQRPRNASLMAGMWELPELAGRNGAAIPLFTLRHSITMTDYAVRVWRETHQSRLGGKWIPTTRLPQVALTGLARKILRKAQVL
jgi:A/G-specific adenine glycosylase